MNKKRDDDISFDNLSNVVLTDGYKKDKTSLNSIIDSNDVINDTSTEVEFTDEDKELLVNVIESVLSDEKEEDFSSADIIEENISLNDNKIEEKLNDNLNDFNSNSKLQMVNFNGQDHEKLQSFKDINNVVNQEKEINIKDNVNDISDNSVEDVNTGMVEMPIIENDINSVEDINSVVNQENEINAVDNVNDTFDSNVEDVNIGMVEMPVIENDINSVEDINNVVNQENEINIKDNVNDISDNSVEDVNTDMVEMPVIENDINSVEDINSVVNQENEINAVDNVNDISDNSVADVNTGMVEMPVIENDINSVEDINNVVNQENEINIKDNVNDISDNSVEDVNTGMVEMPVIENDINSVEDINNVVNQENEIKIKDNVNDISDNSVEDVNTGMVGVPVIENDINSVEDINNANVEDNNSVMPDKVLLEGNQDFVNNYTGNSVIDNAIYYDVATNCFIDKDGNQYYNQNTDANININNNVNNNNNYDNVYRVKIVKEKPSLIRMIINVLSYTLFILLLLLGIVLLFYFVDQKVREAKGDTTPSKYNAYVVLTGSMIPTIDINDVVVTKYIEPKDLKKNDIITFYSEYYNLNVTHRIIEVFYDDTTNEYMFKTRGDNNNADDFSLLNGSDVYGKVIIKIPKLGYIQNFLAKDGGWIIVILIPCLAILSYDIMKLFKMAGNKTKILK